MLKQVNHEFKRAKKINFFALFLQSNALLIRVIDERSFNKVGSYVAH